MSLRALSVELLEQILSKLHYFDICNVKLANHFLYDVVKKSPLVQYRARLFLYGFWDDFDGGSTIDIAARQNQLRAHRSRWSRLEWATRTTLKLRATESRVTGGVLHGIEDDRILHFVRLPSVSRNITQDEWTLPDLGFKIEHYSIDPAVDLLVALENQLFTHSCVRLHILRASTGEHHPLASVPVVSHTIDMLYACTVLISGSQVFLSFRPGEILTPDDIVIWEWKTGELVFKYEGKHERDFVVLAESRLLLTRCESYTPGSAPPRITLELYDTTLGEDAWDSRCVFALPEGSRVRLPEVSHSGFCPRTTSTFYKRPEDHILLIFRGSGPTGITAIAAFVSTLLHFSKPGRLVAWDEWKKYAWIADPQESAIFSFPLTFVSSSGFLTYRPHPDEEELLRVTVTSFQPSIGEKSSPTFSSAQYDGRSDHVPLMVAARRRELDVHVSLPELEDLWGMQVMMTEDNIIITTSSSEAPEWQVTILTF